jgi:hypothetical protein
MLVHMCPENMLCLIPLDPAPVGVNDPNVEVGQFAERDGTEVDPAPDATFAAVDDGHVDALATVGDAKDVPAARVLAGVVSGTIPVELLLWKQRCQKLARKATGEETEARTHLRVECGHHVVLGMPLATGTKAWVEPGDFSDTIGGDLLGVGGKSRGNAQKGGRGGEKES